MKRSAWLRLIAVILIISMMAAPVSAATMNGSTGARNSLIGNIIDLIRDFIRDLFDGWFDQPGDDPITPTTPVDPVNPTIPINPEEPDPTEPSVPGETDPSVPGETEPGATDPDATEPEEVPETTLELVEGYNTVENGQLLRGETYTLSEILAEQSKPSNPPFSLRNNGFGATTLGGNALSTPLALNTFGALNAMAESDTTVEYTKIASITVNEVWTASGGTANNTWYATPYYYFTGSEYRPVEILNMGSYFMVSYVNDQGSRPNAPAGLGALNGTDDILDCLYQLADNSDIQKVDLGLTVTARYSTNRLTWNAEDGVTYTVQRSDDNATWTDRATVTGGSYLDETAGKNTQYYYRLTVNGASSTGVQGHVTGMNALKEIAVLFYEGNDEITFDRTNKVEIATGDKATQLNALDSGTIIYKATPSTTSGIQAVLGTNNGKFVGSKDGKFRHQLGGLSGQHDSASVTAGVANTAGFTYDDSNGHWFMSSNGSTMSPIDLNEASYGILTDVNANTYYAGGSSTSSFNGTINYILVLSEVLTDAELSALTAANENHNGSTTQPEQPENQTKLVYFPVTMFNYDMNTMNEKTISMYEEGFTLYSGIHFSNGKPGGNVTYAVTAHTGEYTNGQYVIQNFIQKDHSQPSWLTYSTEGEKGIIAVADQADATRWTLTRVPGANVFTLTTEVDGTTYYMTFGNETSGITTEYTEVTLVYYTHTNAGIQLRKDGYYLGHSVDNLFCGNTDSTSTSNGMAFFPVNANGTIGTTSRNVTTINGAVTSGFSRWNWWSYLEDGDAAQNKFFAELVQHELDENDDIVFNTIEPGIFKTDTGDNIADKDVYTNVGLPFVLDDDGFYTFDSDKNGVYFADTNGDGRSDPKSGTETELYKLQFDPGIPQGWSGMYYGDGSSKLWAPFNTNTNDTGEAAIDYHFGMRADIPFSMTSNGRVKSTDDNSAPIEFTFSGDDDVWIFIDGHLVIDLGGIHNRIGATINFAENTITYFIPESNTNTNELGCYNDRTRYPLNEDGVTITTKLYNDAEGEGPLGQSRVDFAAEEEHVMSIFYMERGKGTSNCHIQFNLPMRDTVLVTKDITKSWSQARDNTDGPDRDGTEHLTAKEQAAVDKLNFYFKLWKQEKGGELTVVKNTNYYLLDKDGKVLDIRTTGTDGKFALKNGQSAKFMTDISNKGVTYYVEELDLDLDTFLTPDYTYAGVATNGFQYVNAAGETIKITNASQIGEHELPMDATVLKSYEITAYGSIEAIDSLAFNCVNYLNAELPNPTARAYEDMIVLDYGLPVQIDPLHNDLFRGDNIEIVAWGDETLELNEELDDDGNAIPYGTEGGTTWSGNKVLAAAYVSNGTTYSSTPVDMADCLYTFKKNADGTYEIFSTAADGTKVYLNQYTTDIDRVPNDSIPGKISVSESTNENMFRLLANAVEGGSGSNRTLHFHSDAAMPFWNRCGNDTSKKCSEYLYRPASANDQSSTEIPGYVMVTSLDEIKDGGQYLIVHDSDVDSNLYVLHPSTSNSQWDHVAKVGTTTSPAIGTSFSFDSGNVTFKDKTYAEYEHKNEKNETYYTYDRDTFEYELTEQLTEVEEIRYIIKVNSTVEEAIGDETVTKTACRYAIGTIYIVPATIMYYEENFSDMITFTDNTKTGNKWGGTVETAGNSNYQEPGVVGTATDSTYGSDVAYLDDSFDSNGTSRYADTTAGALQFSYSFTGTGTTIFARTSDKTGYIQVKIYEGTDISNDTLIDISYRDTYWKDQNNTTLDSSGTLYNIPVYTNEDLVYGTYTVVCTVAKAGTPTDGNKNGAGNEFYLDGIRVMQPLNKVVVEDADYDSETGEMISDVVYDDMTAKALNAYAMDGESNLDVVTLREKLLADYPTIDGEPEEGEMIEPEEQWPFVVLTDVNGEIILASDYKSIGPKEEVYLAPGQTVSFSLKYWEPEGLKLYMGMKAPFGNAKVAVGHELYELNNAPDCYYDVTSNNASLIQPQITDDDGRPLYQDKNGNSIYEVINEDKSKSYFYCDSGNKCSDDVIKTMEPCLEDYYVITYTFTASEGIVSLTNIKVVGNYEFTIINGDDVNVDGNTGGNAENP